MLCVKVIRPRLGKGKQWIFAKLCCEEIHCAIGNCIVFVVCFHFLVKYWHGIKVQSIIFLFQSSFNVRYAFNVLIYNVRQKKRNKSWSFIRTKPIFDDNAYLFNLLPYNKHKLVLLSKKNGPLLLSKCLPFIA